MVRYLGIVDKNNKKCSMKTDENTARCANLITKYLKRSRICYDLGNRRRKYAWLRRITKMKNRNGILRVGDIFRRLPVALRYVVPDPIHKTLKFAPSESGIEGRINLELR